MPFENCSELIFSLLPLSHHNHAYENMSDRDYMQSNTILVKQKKEKTLCCCGWGAVCQYIGRVFMELPAGSLFELYKMHHVFIHHHEDSIKANKMAKVLRRHLSIERLLPKIFCVARHHFPIKLLQWHETKKQQWQEIVRAVFTTVNVVSAIIIIITQ